MGGLRKPQHRPVEGPEGGERHNSLLVVVSLERIEELCSSSSFLPTLSDKEAREGRHVNSSAQVPHALSSGKIHCNDRAFLCVCVSEYYGAGAQMACWLAPSFHPMHAPWLVCQPFLSLARPEKAIRSGTQLYMYGCNSSSLPCPPPSGAASHIFTICRRMTERDGERRNATQRHSGPRRNVPLAKASGTGTRDGSQLSEPLQSPAWRRFTWAHVSPERG